MAVRNQAPPSLLGFKHTVMLCVGGQLMLLLMGSRSSLTAKDMFGEFPVCISRWNSKGLYPEVKRASVRRRGGKVAKYGEQQGFYNSVHL